jgi:hypothetical protein
VVCAAQYRGQVEVDAVVSAVTVRDGKGRLVTDVPRSAFHLYVDGMEVPIHDLSRESDLPLSLGFIIDTSGSMAGHKATACRELVTAFLGEVSAAASPGDAAPVEHDRAVRHDPARA